MQERTLAILKPDCLKKKLVGTVLERIQKNGFTISGMKMLHLDEKTAKEFYKVHKDKPFYSSLINFMTEGPVIVAVLEKENAIESWRALMGNTDPRKAAEGTIRKEFAENVERNLVHGSDAQETAKTEVSFFFSTAELL